MSPSSRPAQVQLAVPPLEPRPGPSWWWLVTLLVIAAATTPLWPPLVVGDHAVPGFVAFLAAAVGACVVAAARAPTWASKTRRVALTALGLTLPGAVVGFQAMTTTSYVLPQHGPDGCRVVAVESAFLTGGRGQLGTIIAPIGFAPIQLEYTVDDGYTPIAHESYTLSWGATGGNMRVWGGPFDPVMQDETRLHC